VTVIIEEPGQADTGTGDTAFQAGLAAATAANAAEDAAEAGEAAEEAQATAERAEDTAQAANENAWDAKAAVSALENEVRAGFAELKDLIAGSAVTDSAGTDDGTPAAPERKADPAPAAEPDPAAEETKPRGYGSRSWFGGS
jgi:hypothetical protein